MLFFELFPAFMAIVVVIAGMWLYIADRNARMEADSEDAGERTPPPAGGER
jgi:hypothetical protein